jgi:hypothetical protein
VLLARLVCDDTFLSSSLGDIYDADPAIAGLGATRSIGFAIGLAITSVVA